MIFRAALVIAALLIAACTPAEQYMIEATPSALKVRAGAGRILVRTVSLPTYAAASEITTQGPMGALMAREDGIWADDPERATTLVITRHLNKMTRSIVAPEPWPLAQTPQAVVDIRVEQFIATNDNRQRLLGQYFIGGDEGSNADLTDAELDAGKSPPRTFPNRARLFDIHVARADDTPAGLAAAQSDALRLLAEKIARDLAR